MGRPLRRQLGDVVYLVTNRTVEARSWLKPTPETLAVVGAWLAYAAERFGSTRPLAAHPMVVGTAVRQAAHPMVVGTAVRQAPLFGTAVRARPMVVGTAVRQGAPQYRDGDVNATFPPGSFPPSRYPRARCFVSSA